MLGKVESSLDFTQRAPVERQDEVGETVVSVNRLVERSTRGDFCGLVHDAHSR